jgi:hypothetical protein
MNRDWLTVQLVEELQERAESGRAIDSIVGSLIGTTLPGIMEYGCLRKSSAISLPSLPSSVESSLLGKALSAVPSALGLRADGAARPPLRRIDVRLAEFYVATTEDDLDDNWKQFSIRFARSAEHAGLKKLVANGLRGSLHEMTEIALIHGQSDVAVLVGYRVLKGTAQFCVADVGIGVLASLRNCSDFSHLRFENEAIKEALRDGVSCFGRNRGGMGFRQVFKSLTEHWGVLRFRSGEGCITMNGTDLETDRGSEHYPPGLPGFQVTVTCRANDVAPSEPLL